MDYARSRFERPGTMETTLFEPLPKMRTLSTNEKRTLSCKAVGGAKKRAGHLMEEEFMAAFGVTTPITYKAEADAKISPENPGGAALIAQFPDLTSYNVSIKSGKNLQFTLGRIDEITTADDKLKALGERTLWETYLGKTKSKQPADLLAYRDGESWVLFRMSEVIDYIVSECKWRLLPTGRAKGDFDTGTPRGVVQYLTYEYRPTHGSHFLGANGNKGYAFIKLLMTKIRYVVA